MHVLVAGHTGVIGRQLVPLLQAAGHRVTGLARTDDGTSGADAVVEANALDRAKVIRAVKDAKPDAIVHVLTAIPASPNPKNIASEFGATNALRMDATRYLLEAAALAGTSRIVGQSIAFAYAPGDGPATESDPLWHGAPAPFQPILAAVESMESQITSAGGTVLRFGHLCGPGTAFAPDGAFVEQIRAGKIPIVGQGAAEFSFTHVRDAASAIVAALESEHTGTFNVVDDEPVAVATWLPAIAAAFGAKKPMRVPAFIARMAVGTWGVAFMNELRGASNAHAKQVLGWRPSLSTWKESVVEPLER